MRGSFLPDKSSDIGQCSFDEPIPHRGGRQVPYPSLHQGGPHCWPHPDDSLRLCPTKLTDPPRLFPLSFLYHWPALAHASDFPKISQTSSIWPQPALYFLLSGLMPALAASGCGSQLGFFWAPPRPAQVAAICRLFCSSSWLVQAEHRWQLTLACTSWEAPELVYPVECFISCEAPPATSSMAYSRGRLSRHQSLAEVRPTSWAPAQLILHSDHI
ncbi:hypothetical protein HJG60_007848 [Phyllostomus discolor]|uniref:Uncharacterized protein n=1 Tax=Phyllostomus discolor TaxID=89673 RepID=A0A834BNC4_9CHIR|nr:hypothetical protein HJG60_007848 [Phyllostomus discolor]